MPVSGDVCLFTDRFESFTESSNSHGVGKNASARLETYESTMTPGLQNSTVECHNKLKSKQKFTEIINSAGDLDHARSSPGMRGGIWVEWADEGRLRPPNFKLHHDLTGATNADLAPKS